MAGPFGQLVLPCDSEMMDMILVDAQLYQIHFDIKPSIKKKKYIFIKKKERKKEEKQI